MRGPHADRLNNVPFVKRDVVIEKHLVPVALAPSIEEEHLATLRRHLLCFPESEIISKPHCATPGEYNVPQKLRHCLKSRDHLQVWPIVIKEETSVFHIAICSLTWLLL